MTETAMKYQVPPLRISFVEILERIRSAALWMAVAATLRVPTMFETCSTRFPSVSSHSAIAKPPRRLHENVRLPAQEEDGVMSLSAWYWG
jgi:hypothetical protein